MVPSLVTPSICHRSAQAANPSGARVSEMTEAAGKTPRNARLTIVASSESL
jgi:hypothetical protein